MPLKPYNGDVDQAEQKRYNGLTPQEAREVAKQIRMTEPAPDFPTAQQLRGAVNRTPANVIGAPEQEMPDLPDPMGIGPQPLGGFKPYAGITDQDYLKKRQEVDAMPFMQRNLARIGSGMTDAALGVKQLDADIGEKLHGTWLGKLVGSYDPAEGRSAKIKQEVTEKRALDAPLRAGLGGTVVGAIGESLPFAVAPQKAAQNFGGALMRNATMGAAQGALSPVAEGESRLKNAALGAVGGGVGTTVAAGAGRLVRPVRSTTPLNDVEQQLVKKASSEGFQFTPGQATGSKPLQRLESVLEGMQAGGGKINKNMARNAELLNQKALETIGVRGKSVISPGDLENAQIDIGNQIERIVGNRGITIDKSVPDKLDKIAADIMQVVPEGRSTKALGYIDGIKQKVDGVDVIPFEHLQANISAITSDMQQMTRAGDYKGARELGKVLGVLYDSVGKSLSPDEYIAWQSARMQYSNLLKLMADGVVENGNIVPSKLASVVKRPDQRGYAKADVEDNKLKFLAETGKYLKEKYPDSGTASRSWLQGALGGAGGTIGALASGGDPSSAAMGALGGFFGPRMAQAALMSKPATNYFMRQPTKVGKLLADPATRGAALTGAALLPELFR